MSAHTPALISLHLLKVLCQKEKSLQVSFKKFKTIQAKCVKSLN